MNWIKIEPGCELPEKQGKVISRLVILCYCYRVFPETKHYVMAYYSYQQIDGKDIGWTGIGLAVHHTDIIRLAWANFDFYEQTNG